jgi:hypothetical protein
LTPAPADLSVPKIIDGEKYWWHVVLQRWCKHSPYQCKAKAKQTGNISSNLDNKQSERKTTVCATMALIEEAGKRLLRPVIKRYWAISKCFFPFPSVGAFFSWWWAQAIMLVVSFVVVPWQYFVRELQTVSKYVRPYFGPIIE